MSQSKTSLFFQALKYGNIILTGLILAYPRKFMHLVYGNCKRPPKNSKVIANESDNISQASSLIGFDDEQVAQKFKAACKLVRKEQNISTNDSLELYGLFKQATVGTCTLPKPSSINMEAKYKWDHWTRFKDLKQSEAMMLYVEYVINLFPKHAEYLSSITHASIINNDENEQNLSEKDLFESDSDNGLESNPKNDIEEEEQKEKTARGFGLSVSKMQNNMGDDFLEIKKTNHVSEEVIEFFALLDNQDYEAIQKKINEGYDLLEKNNQGTTPLHYCIENDYIDIFSMLLHSFPNIDEQDSDGYTPLYVAALNENDEIVIQLLQKGADPFIKDHEDHSTYDIANSKTKSIIENYIQQKKSSQI